MLRVGIIGWRGMVGSVLMDRMREERDFDGITCTFFSTSNAGSAAPDVGQGPAELVDAHSLDALEKHDVLVSCQGGDYTSESLPEAPGPRVRRLLDRRGLDPAHGGRNGAHPRSRQPQT